MHADYSHLRALALTCALLAHPVSALAQGGASAPLVAGSPAESYLRYLQTLGAAPLYPWSMRGLSPREMDRLRPLASGHPWTMLPELRADSARSARPRRVALIPPQADLWYNTRFAHGINDGAVWRGRGLTASLTGGGALRWGVLSLTAAPVLFWTENRPFELMPSLTAGTPFASGDSPNVDLPQRFGAGSYARLDAGESTLRADAFGLAAGLSTASQWWGPMSEHPFILGNNAGGFPHLFLGSSTPWNVWVGRVHARLVYGRLSRTGFTDIADTTGNPHRFAAGIVGTFTPRGAPGLELGAGRFYHRPWRPGGPTAEDFASPLEAVFKDSFKGKRNTAGDAGGDFANQLATVYFRWVLPRSGFETYGELGREDHSSNTFDFILEPDHSVSYGLGLRRAWRRDEGISAVRGEIMNFQISHLGLQRAQGGIYIHTGLREGHTHRGQLLGAGFGVQSAAAASLAFERFSRGGYGWQAGWSRTAVRDAVGRRVPDGEPQVDVQHELRAERTMPWRGFMLTGGLSALYEFNRHLRFDTGNVQLSMRMRWLGERRIDRPVPQPAPAVPTVPPES